MKSPERESELGKGGKVQRNELSRKKVQDVEPLSRAELTDHESICPSTRPAAAESRLEYRRLEPDQAIELR
jgi:hypothetical protein